MTRLLYQVHHALRNFHVDVEQELLDGIMLALGERKNAHSSFDYVCVLPCLCSALKMKCKILFSAQCHSAYLIHFVVGDDLRFGGALRPRILFGSGLNHVVTTVRVVQL